MSHILLSTIEMVQHDLPSVFPPLPPADILPWPAEVVEAHRSLSSTFLTSRRALHSDESDPVRLGHHLKQVETFMTSIVNVLGIQGNAPLPPTYVEMVKSTVDLLVDRLRIAVSHATSACVPHSVATITPS